MESLLNLLPPANFHCKCAIVVFSSLVFEGCSDEQEELSDFERFTVCSEAYNGEDGAIYEGVKEACLQKHERLLKSFPGRNVSADLYGSYSLQVSFTNPSRFIVTNIEVDISTPLVQDGEPCSQKGARCGHFYTSGRTWIMPGESGVALVSYPKSVFMENDKGKKLWSFQIESVRVLSLQSDR